MPVPKPRVLVADDHEGFLKELSKLLDGEFELVGIARDGVDLIEQAGQLNPDAIVTDFRMPRLSGLAAGRKLLEGQICSAIVLVTSYRDAHLAKSAFSAGVKGYVLKERAGDDLIPAIHSALAGKLFSSIL